MKSSVRAVIVEEGKLLCIKLANCLDEGRNHYYVLPGREVKTIENTFDALRRHCLDTLNLKVKVHDLLFVRDCTSYQQNGDESYLIREIEYIFLCYVVENSDNLIRPQLDCYQIGVEWIPIRNLTDYSFYPKQLSDALWSFCLGDDVDIYLRE